MKIHNVTQGTPEWMNLRAGIPTASAFDLILTPGGKPSKSQERYMHTLLAERLMGHPIQDHISMWMQRGKETELAAVTFYEFQRDMETVPIGFVTNDAGTIGASPDRFVGDEGCLEIKVPKEAVHMLYLLESGSAYDEYRVQCQGQLWITGRKWVDLVSYHPELPEALIRINRDEEYIALLSKEVAAFSEKLEAKFQELQSRGWVIKRTTKWQAPAGVEIPKLPPLTELVKEALKSGQRP